MGLTTRDRQRLEAFARDIGRTCAAHGADWFASVRLKGVAELYDFQVGRNFVAVFADESVPGDDALLVVDIDAGPVPF